MYLCAGMQTLHDFARHGYTLLITDNHDMLFDKKQPGFLLIHWDVANTGFVIQELDSAQFVHDIIFCLESDSIVVSFSLRTGYLDNQCADIVQFWFNISPAVSCHHVLYSFYRQRTTYEVRVNQSGLLPNQYYNNLITKTCHC